MVARRETALSLLEELGEAVPNFTLEARLGEILKPWESAYAPRLEFRLNRSRVA